MTTTEHTPEIQRAAWDWIEARLAALDWTPPATPSAAADPPPLPTVEQIDRLLAQMPPRLADEPLADWLRRGFGLKNRPAARPRTALTQLPRRVRRRKGGPFGRALAYAAAPVESAVPSLPPSLVLDSGAFRVGFAPADGQIHVTLQALGMTLVRQRGRAVQVTGPAGLEPPLAEVTLGSRGEGRFVLADTAEHRRLLLGLEVWPSEPA